MNLPIQVPGHAALATVRERVSPAEWQLRCDLAAGVHPHVGAHPRP